MNWLKVIESESAEDTAARIEELYECIAKEKQRADGLVREIERIADEESWMSCEGFRVCYSEDITEAIQKYKGDNK